MSRKSLFNTLFAVGLFTLFILAAQLGANSGAIPSTGGEVVYDMTDWIERHKPLNAADPAVYDMTDWIERHKPLNASGPAVYDMTDWIERHKPLNVYYTDKYNLTDWIERHSPLDGSATIDIGETD